MTRPRLGSECHGVRGGGGDETDRSQAGPRGTTASERAGAQVEQAMLIVAVVDGGQVESGPHRSGKQIPLVVIGTADEEDRRGAISILFE